MQILTALVIAFIVNCTFAQNPLEIAKCTQFKKRIFESVSTFLPLVNEDNVKEVRVPTDRCKRTYSPFVVGGEKAEPKEFPESARLGRHNGGEGNAITWFCGGSLISERFILTAAHCFFSENGKVNRVRLGDLDFDSDTDNAQPEDFGVNRIIPHPDYNWNKTTTYHDIGLIELDRVVRFNVYKLPSCLPIDNDENIMQFVAIGWGAKKFIGPDASWLQKVALDRFSYTNCASFVNDEGILDNGLDDASQLCAGSDLARDTCNGDSGGPLLKYHPNYPCMHVIVGVTSTGISGCGTPGVPAIYTRVRHYINWINDIVFK